MGRLTAPAASAAHALLKMFRVPGALHRNLGDGALDLADILGVSAMSAARMFSARRSSLVVPGIGTIHGFCGQEATPARSAPGWPFCVSAIA